ncbi:MAG TPA: ABC transporter permease [Solirubrobacteraceae bacterium]|jgi:ABC-2 type transport system permease protein|nr:ABC transporter permease [Solirubrobacteraceae bacterium]
MAAAEGAAPGLGSTVSALARRALRNSLRRPQFLAPLVVFPSLMLAVNVGGLSRTTALPGFPHVHGFLDFQLGAALTQSLMLGGVSAGIATALEIEGGFFERLVAAPIPRISIVLGRVLATGVLSVGQALYFLGLGLIFGAHIQAGVPGVAVVLAIACVAGLGFGALGVMIALRARNASTVQGIFPIVFVVLFISSAFFPEKLLSSPADAVAAYNPLSYIADGLRNPIIDSISLSRAVDGLLAATGIAVVAIALSVVALRGRLGDT